MKEISKSQNIKDKTTRKNVVSALRTCIFLIQQSKKTDNGLVVCAGIISSEHKDYKDGIAFSPPKKILQYFYKCDTRFHLNPIIDMYSKTTSYGIVLISGKEFRAYSANLTGKHIECKKLVQINEELQKKQRKGGQSACRIDRLRQIKRDGYVKRMAESIIAVYTEDNHRSFNIEGLIVAGSGNAKREVMDEKIFKQYFYDKVLKVMECKEIDNTTVCTICKSCSDLFIPKEQKIASKIIGEIKEMIIRDSNMLLFGVNECLISLKNHTLKTIIHSPSIGEKTKTELATLNTYGCQLIETLNEYITQVGNCVGIKYYSHEIDELD